MEYESHTNYKDTVPLLGGHASPSLRAADRSQAMPRVDRKSKPVILGLDRVMTTSVYSDKMQVSGDDRHPISLLHVHGKDNTCHQILPLNQLLCSLVHLVDNSMVAFFRMTILKQG